jgi:hypothetical protein
MWMNMGEDWFALGVDVARESLGSMRRNGTAFGLDEIAATLTIMRRVARASQSRVSRLVPSCRQQEIQIGLRPSKARIRQFTEVKQKPNLSESISAFEGSTLVFEREENQRILWVVCPESGESC